MNTRWAGRNWRETKVLAPPPVGGLEPSDSHLAVFLDDIGNIEIVLALLKYFENVLVVVNGVDGEEWEGRGRIQRSCSRPQSIDPALRKWPGFLIGANTAVKSQNLETII